MRTDRILLAALAAGAMTSQAAAQVPQSTYTKAGEKDCKTVEQSKPKDEMPWSVQSCPGRAGLVVRISDADLRQTVSVGRSIAAAAKERAAEQSFGPFNHAHGTIEWRASGGKPYAIIQRWSLADAEDTGADGKPREFGLLVVTRLGAGMVCHIAYVDAAANPDANALARKAADEKARTFDCAKGEAAIVGKPGRATRLAKP